MGEETVITRIITQTFYFDETLMNYFIHYSTLGVYKKMYY